jgi:hypothetical protein
VRIKSTFIRDHIICNFSKAFLHTLPSYYHNNLLKYEHRSIFSVNLFYPILNQRSFKTVQDCPRPSKSVQDRPRPFKTIQDHPRLSKTVQDRPRPSKTVQDRPIPFNTIQDCSRPSKTLQDCTFFISW